MCVDVDNRRGRRSAEAVGAPVMFSAIRQYNSRDCVRGSSPSDQLGYHQFVFSVFCSSENLSEFEILLLVSIKLHLWFLAPVLLFVQRCDRISRFYSHRLLLDMREQIALSLFVICAVLC